MSPGRCCSFLLPGRWPSDQDLGEADHIHTHTCTCRTCPHGLVNTRVPQDTRVCTHAHRMYAHTCSQGLVYRTHVLRGTRVHIRTHSNAHTCPRTCVRTHTCHRTHVCTHRVHAHICSHGFYTGHCTHSMCTYAAQDTYVCTHAHRVHAHTCSHGLIHGTHVPQETHTCTRVHTVHAHTRSNQRKRSSFILSDAHVMRTTCRGEGRVHGTRLSPQVLCWTTDPWNLLIRIVDLFLRNSGLSLGKILGFYAL